jgi:predicted RNA binding protein YcfA (HicA-like mRNA interferase family)
LKFASGKEFIKLLEKHGWRLMRVNGSHHIDMKPGCRERISVPVHGHQDLKIGLLKHLMEIAGIDESRSVKTLSPP